MRRFYLAIPMLISLLISGCAGSLNQQGLIANQKGDYKQAIEYFTLQTKEYPQDGWGYYNLCEALIKTYQYKEAIDPCQKGLKATYTTPGAPGSPGYRVPNWALTANYLGIAYFQNGKTEEAIVAAEHSIRINPNDAVVFCNLAAYFSKNKRYEEAITAAKRASEINPGYADAYYQQGYAYGEKESYDEGISAIKKALKIDPSHPKAYTTLGYYLDKTGNYDEAIEIYKGGIKQGQNQRNYLGFLYYRLGRYDEAIATVTEAIPQLTYQGVGFRFEIKDNFPVVLEVFTDSPAAKAGLKVGITIVAIAGESIKDWSQDRITKRLRGETGSEVIITVKEKGAKFAITITRGLVIQKEAVEYLGLRSLAHRQKGNLVQATIDARAALAIDSSDDNTLLSNGAVALDRGQDDEAIQLLVKLKAIPAANLLQATALARKGATAEAVRVYLAIPDEAMSQKNIPLASDRQALLKELKPVVKAKRAKAKALAGQNMAREMLAELAMALQIADDTEAAAIQADLANVVQNNPLLALEVPEEAREHALRGEMSVQEGNFRQAVDEFKQALRIAPYAAKLYINGAMVNAEIKNYPEAIRQMKTYLIFAADAPDSREAKDQIIRWKFMMEQAQ